MKIRLVLIAFILLTETALSQVNVSDAFQNVLKKIAKETVKNAVTEWVSRQDITLGIVSKDLITQLIDNGKDEKAVLKSAANVTATMLYLGGVKRISEAFLQNHPELMTSAVAYDWDRDHLIAYLSLYFYYSERLKYHLYVSSEILKMESIKNAVENMETNDSVKLPVAFSRFVKIKYQHGDEAIQYLWLDVRIAEFIEQSLSNLLIDPSQYVAGVDSGMISLRKVVGSSIPTEMDGVTFMKQIVTNLVLSYQNSYRYSPVFSLDKRLTGKDTSAVQKTMGIGSSDINNVLAQLFYDLIETSDWTFVDRDNSQKFLLSNITELLNQWLTGSRESGWHFEYSVSLGGTFFANYTKAVDLTVLDQIRIAKHCGPSTYYVFTGGFLDPLIKETIYKTGLRVYLAGFGYEYSYFHVDLVVGVPYTNLKSTFGYGVSAGYEIPLTDLLEQ